MCPTPVQDPQKASIGVEGLDAILSGGLTRHRSYLVEGTSGSGKTTLALQYLIEGVRQGETVLYITLSETAEELRAAATSHGWSLEGIDIHELLPTQDLLREDERYTLFHPSEVELSETSSKILAEVERLQPTRLAFDSLAELRMLAGSPVQYRRQVLALKQFFVGRRCTVLTLDDVGHGEEVHSFMHAIIRLEQLSFPYGEDRRRLRVMKYRAVAFRSGFHDYVIRRGGLRVFPRLVATEHASAPRRPPLSSSVEGLDSLLGGGLDRGTSTLILGPAGAGKSSIATQFVVAAAERGERSAVFVFDEARSTLLDRAAGLGLDMGRHVTEGRISVEQVDPAELSPGEFAHQVAAAGREQGAAIVVIDSLNGYLSAMSGERDLVAHLHELLVYLGQLDVATILIGVQHGLIGSDVVSPVQGSYLADCIVLLRNFESAGEVRQALSVIKKRGGAHERTIRELRLESGGIRIGPPLRQFRGVLTGEPQYEGSVEPLISKPEP